MDIAFSLAVLIALLVGAAVGWLLRSGAVAQSVALAGDVQRLNASLETIRNERDAAERKLSAAQAIVQQAGRWESELNQERKLSNNLASEKAAFIRGEAERERAHTIQIEQLKDMEAKLETRFGELALKALADAQGQFLKRADDRFKQSEEKSSDNLRSLLQPVNERLQRYEEGVIKIERDRTEAYGNLTGLIEAMREGQDRVQTEAQRLVNSLRSAPKTRGRWGEQQLRNVLETCGLSEHSDFMTEVSVDSEDGRFRPDVIIRIPGGRTLIIDAKVSLNSFQDAFEATEDSQRKLHLSMHASAMKAHINTLSSKSYQDRFADTADYVVMFVPGEHFLSAALEHEPQIWDYAFQKKVLLATPTNLIAIARTVASVWRQERLARDAREIAGLGKELFDRLAKATGDIRKVGNGLSTAVNNYNAFVGSFEGRVLSSARRFRDLNIEPGAREIDEIPPVEVLTRSLRETSKSGEQENVDAN